MQRTSIKTDHSLIQTNEITARTAFHEAGHAVSIYRGNREKNLPPVFFEIEIDPIPGSCQNQAKVIDGRLIQHLPVAGLENTIDSTIEERLDFQQAYQADIIHLLVGPLAEARYISIQDNELFSQYLLSFESLHYYGGESDINLATAYLDYFVPAQQKREEISQQLFIEAFQFVEKKQNWIAICRLANYLINCGKTLISCEEIIAIINSDNPLD